MFPFEQFPVYMKAEKLFNLLDLNVLGNNKISDNTRNQLQRAAQSILCNIAEGSGKFSKNDKKNFYTIARGSAYECASILKTLMQQRKISIEYYHYYYKELDEISLMLSHLIIHLRSRIK